MEDTDHSQTQYLQLDTVQGVPTGSPNSEGSNPDSPRRVVAFTPLNTITADQNTLEAPQLTQLQTHINYATVDSPPGGNLSR